MREVAHELGTAGGDSAKIGAQTTGLTDALPDPEGIERVEAWLVSHHGWPID